jgi:hypothetical protein
LEEEVFVDEVRSGRFESRVVDQQQRIWAVDIEMSGGYPPYYTVWLNGKKFKEGPFDDRDKAHLAALAYIDGYDGEVE